LCPTKPKHHTPGAHDVLRVKLFEEASELFNLPENLFLEEYDFEHSIDEDRIISIGPILRSVIVVVSVERDDGNIL
jgi:hypothetical protein